MKPATLNIYYRREEFSRYAVVPLSRIDYLWGLAVARRTMIGIISDGSIPDSYDVIFMILYMFCWRREID